MAFRDDLAPPTSRRTTVMVVLFALSIQAAGIWLVRPPFFYDDAPFAFRYAESIARGEGFRWNLGEDPIWGASAPLWALLLGGLTYLGLTPETAAVGAGWILTLASGAFLALTALRCVGLPGAVWSALFAATNWRFCAGALNGMEGPVAYLLVGAGLWTLSRRAPWAIVGALAGLSFVHKLDFVPFGLLLLAGAWLERRRLAWRASLIALGIAGAWYGFAWVHFGAVVPNSMLTKLSTEWGGVGRGWLVTIALLEGGRLVLVAGAVLAVAALWHRKSVLLAAAGLIVYVALGHSLKPPVEHFGWYQAPIQPALILLAGCGIGAAMQSLVVARGITTRAGIAVEIVALAILGAVVLWQDRPIARAELRWVSHFERDRSDAGRWIDANTPPGATLLTAYGNIAYYAHRRTIDLSYLNRRPPLKSAEALIAESRPEVVAFCPNNTGVAPENYAVPAGYRVAAIFDSAWRDKVGDFYVVVMVREDNVLR